MSGSTFLLAIKSLNIYYASRIAPSPVQVLVTLPSSSLLLSYRYGQISGAR